MGTTRLFSSSTRVELMPKRSRLPSKIRHAKQKANPPASGKKGGAKGKPTTKSTKPTKPTPPPSKEQQLKDRRLPGHMVHSNYIRAVSFLPPRVRLDDDDDDDAARAAAVRLGTTPSPMALNRATSLFVQPQPQFIYSAPRFLNMHVNTRVPEICILGRSNVGKSTLLNALAGLEGAGLAGHSHGASTVRRGLAITSARAGCTTMLNAYGFGPPLRKEFAQTFARVEEAKAAAESRRLDALATAKGAVVSRSEKRARAPGEPAPAYSLIMVDMPGYGYMSRAEWGVEIGKYLAKRPTLRGAVLLVDAVAGLKDGDRQALAMLRDASIRTLVVLTKADKLLPYKAQRPAKRPPQTSTDDGRQPVRDVEADREPVFASDVASAGEQTLRSTCLQVWETLKRTERAGASDVPWMEGQGWSPEIVVTGAGDPKGGGFGVAGARLAICRLAGLISPAKEQHLAQLTAKGEMKRVKAVLTPDDRPVSSVVTRVVPSVVPGVVPGVVPYDQIQWAETETAVTLDQTAELRFVAEQKAARDAQNVGKERRKPAVRTDTPDTPRRPQPTDTDTADVDPFEAAMGMLVPKTKSSPTRGRRTFRHRGVRRS